MTLPTTARQPTLPAAANQRDREATHLKHQKELIDFKHHCRGRARKTPLERQGPSPQSAANSWHATARHGAGHSKAGKRHDALCGDKAPDGRKADTPPSSAPVLPALENDGECSLQTHSGSG